MTVPFFTNEFTYSFLLELSICFISNLSVNEQKKLIFCLELLLLVRIFKEIKNNSREQWGGNGGGKFNYINTYFT